MLSQSISKCIYCNAPFDPNAGEGEHVIPAALGTFKNALICRSICSECNNTLGSLDEVLLRSGPEALLKRYVDSARPGGSRRRRGQGWVSSKGGAVPVGVVKNDDHTELVDVDPVDPRSITTVDQLVIVDSAGIERHIRLFPRMDARAIQKKLGDLPADSGTKIFLHCDQHLNEYYIGELGKLFPKMTYDPLPAREAGYHKVKGQMTFHFDNEYYRALAKIAFHYMLCVSARRFTGHEIEFLLLKEYIYAGRGGVSSFYGKGTIFETPFQENGDGTAYLPRDFFHMLAIDETQKQVSVSVRLFMGPVYVSTLHRFVIGKIRNPVIMPVPLVTSHIYKYEDIPETSYSGSVRKIDMIKIQ